MSTTKVNTVKRMEKIRYMVVAVIAVIGFSYVAYAGYAMYTAFSLVGEKVRIDGKVLTITSSWGGECILSDRTRIHALYARKLLVGGNNGTDK